MRLPNIFLLCLLALTACTATQHEHTVQNSVTTKLKQQPLEAHEVQELNERMLDSYVYGDGLGETAVQVGTAVVFPPYLLVILGNAALSLSGYEPVGVSSVLPEDASQKWKSAYSGVVSVPGKVVANAAGREYVPTTPVDAAKEYLSEREYLAEVF